MIKHLLRIYHKIFFWVDAPHIPNRLKENWVFSDEDEKKECQKAQAEINTSISKLILLIFLILLILVVIRVFYFNIKGADIFPKSCKDIFLILYDFLIKSPYNAP